MAAKNVDQQLDLCLMLRSMVIELREQRQEDKLQNQEIIKELRLQREEDNRQVQALINEMREQREEDRRQTREEREKDKKQSQALIRELQAQRDEDRRRMERELQQLREQVLHLAQRLQERETGGTNEVAEVRSESDCQFNDNIGSLSKILNFLHRQPTSVKILLVIGGISLCSLSVYGLLFTATGTAILTAISSTGARLAAQNLACGAAIAGVGMRVISDDH